MTFKTTENRLNATVRRLKAGKIGGGWGECTACNHTEARVLNEALIAKVPLRMLAATYHVSIAALSRHNKNHISHATPEQRMEVVLDRLIRKCDELEVHEVKENADDEVFGVIDDLRQELLEVKSGHRLWST